MKRLCLCALFLVAGCDRHPDWQGWVYPDGTNRTERLPIGWFNSSAQCRAAAKADIKRLEAYMKDAPPARADYECGLNCSAVAGLRVCEKIER
jgi:hypothetical protein